jgi:4'-phosphopantetheinyl transferase
MNAVLVDVTYWDLTRQRGRLDKLTTLLSTEETARATRLAIRALRERFILAHGILRETLAGATGESATALRFGQGPDGKPTLVDGGIGFNLSKSGDSLLIAMAHGAAVGCDLELLRPNAEARAIAARWFSVSERAALERHKDKDFDRAFMRLWVRKEALLKAVGAGLQGSLGVDTGDVLPIDAPRAVDMGECRLWFVDLAPTPGTVAAVAAERPMALRLTVNA